MRNLEELSAAIAKAINYTPDTTAIFAAEEGFGTASDEIAASLPAGYAVTTAYLDDLDVTDARTTLLGGINDGAGLTVYFGHSSTDQWGAQGLLTTADAAGMTNVDDPTVVVQFGCWNTYFSEPTLQSLGTALSTSAGGAAAVLGATTLTNSVHDAMFGPMMMNAFTSATTIGDAMTAAKHDLAGRTSAIDITLGWTLLGDPTTPLRWGPMTNPHLKRRTLLKAASAAGVVWASPVLESVTAHAAGTCTNAQFNAAFLSETTTSPATDANLQRATGLCSRMAADGEHVYLRRRSRRGARPSLAVPGRG